MRRISAVRQLPAEPPPEFPRRSPEWYAARARGELDGYETERREIEDYDVLLDDPEADWPAD